MIFVPFFADIAAPATVAAAPTAWQAQCKATLEKAGIAGGKIVLKTWADSTLGEQPLVVLENKQMMAVTGRQFPEKASPWFHSVGYAVRSGVRHFGWVAGDDAFMKTMTAALDRCIADGDQGEAKK